jgi:hypothetical protein
MSVLLKRMHILPLASNGFIISSLELEIMANSALVLVLYHANYKRYFTYNMYYS